MNLVFFIFCAFVIITPNIINAKILKYDNYTCYESCCRRAFKPSNYSDVLIEYSINFTVDEVIVTIWPYNTTKYDPELYSYTTNETGTSQSQKFSARDDFKYCFNAIKYGSEDNNSRMSFTFSFGYEYNAEKKRSILDDTIELIWKQNSELLRKKIEEKKMEEEIERKEGMKKQLLQNETTSTDNSLRDENELIINEEYQNNYIKVKINQDLVEEDDKTLMNKQIQPENRQIEIQQSEIQNIKNKLLNEDKTMLIDNYETNKIDDTEKKREININFTQMTTEIPKQIIKIEQLSIDKENKTENKLSIQNEIIKIEKQQQDYKEKQDKFNNYNITKNLTEIKYQTTTIKSEPIKTDEDVKNTQNYLNYLGTIWNKAWSARRT